MTIHDFFKKYHYISQREIADRAGINRSLMGQYACGVKQPSPTRAKQIIKAVKAIGKELTNAKFSYNE